MKTKIYGWSLTEVKRLLNMISNKGSKSLLSVFNDFATMTKRQPFSVRNFHYKLMEQAEHDNEIVELLGIKKMAQNIKNNHFSKDDTVILLQNLLNNDKNISIRRACLDLANGDDKLMIRYQNKYRNLLKTKPQLVSKVANELRAKGVKVRNVGIKDNIAVMPTPKAQITDKEIQSLFFGLVRLIRKSAEENVEIRLKRDAEFASTALQNSLIDLRRKEILIRELEEQNRSLKIKIKNIEKNLQRNQEKMMGNMTTISNLLGKSKMEELKNFIAKLNLADKTKADNI